MILNLSSRRRNWIDGILAAFLLLTAPFFLFPSFRTIWLLAFVPLSLMVRRMTHGRIFSQTVTDPALLVLALQMGIGCFLVPDLVFSLPKITGLAFGLLVFYYLATFMETEKRLKLGLAGLFSSGLGFSLIGITGMSWDYDSLVFSIVRLLGINLDKTAYTRKVIPALNKIIPSIRWDLPGAEAGFNANAIGGMLILVLPLGWALGGLYVRQKKRRNAFLESRMIGAIWIAASIVLSVVLFLTLSIAAWAALFLGVWIVFFSRRAKFISLTLGVILLGVVLVVFQGEVKRAVDRVSIELDYEKIEQRLEWWSVGLETISQNPVFGTGMNRMRLHPKIGFKRAHLHNHFLQTAAEMGLPALIAYLSLLMAAGLMCFQIQKRAGPAWIKKTALGLGCGQVAHFFFGWIDSIPLGAKVGLVFWMSLGLITALYIHTFNHYEDRIGEPKA
ncbi:MAG: O-antigen ligase family protein [Candidatus Aminicenantes bacterium]|nr:O-antigen ligase family protein [Candidatus Aminicenantes bacterium]